MSFRKYLLNFALLGIFLLTGSAAIGAPAIEDSNFQNAADWTVFGGGANTGVVFNSTNANVFSNQVSGVVQSTGGLSSSGTSRAGLLAQLTAINGGPLQASFIAGVNAFSATASLTGAYQTFSTGQAGDLSFDLQRFTNKGNGTYAGDPFTFLYNLDTDMGSFTRGGVLGTGVATTDIADFTLNGVTYTHGAAPSSFTFSGLNPGNYVFGVGWGSDGSAGGNNEFGALAVRNIQSPEGVPEIDAGAATLPLALVFLVFACVQERKTVPVKV